MMRVRLIFSITTRGYQNHLPHLDAGNSPNSTPVSDAYPQAPARDAGNATNGVSDAGMTVPASPVDAGQNQPDLLAG